MTCEAVRLAALVFDDRCLGHDAGLQVDGWGNHYPFPGPIAHVSSPALISRAWQLIDDSGVADLMVRVPAYEADDASLLTIHTKEYLQRVIAAGRAGGEVGEETMIGAGGDCLARLSAGAAMAAVDIVATSDSRRAYSLMRPPGHHAMADHGMGFCVFSNVAIAARHAQLQHGLERVMIVDWDVHHGNGTQAAFYNDESVLFISLHQDDLYPVGWGKATDCGEGSGRGTTVNIPLPAGSGDVTYLRAFERVVLPIGELFGPDLVMISAGQDASVSDPLARMSLTTDAYRRMTDMMIGLAQDACEGRLVVVQEGGYAAEYAPYCSAEIAETLAGVAGAERKVPEPYGPRVGSLPSVTTVSIDAAASIDRVVNIQRSFWRI